MIKLSRRGLFGLGVGGAALVALPSAAAAVERPSPKRSLGLGWVPRVSKSQLLQGNEEFLERFREPLFQRGDQIYQGLIVRVPFVDNLRKANP